MRFLKCLMLFGLLVASSAAAQTDPRAIHVFLGGNGVWYQGDRNLPADFEVGSNAAASMSPHLSLVGAAYYGVQESYLRGSFGARATATDVNDPNFSIGIGAQYHVSSEPQKRPQEFAGDVSLGWRPYPVNMPRVIVIAQSWWGFRSNQIGLIAGIRYSLGSFGGER